MVDQYVPAALDAPAYLSFLEREYLTPYVSRGGAAVKLLVTGDEASAEKLAAGLAACRRRFPACRSGRRHHPGPPDRPGVRRGGPAAGLALVGRGGGAGRVHPGRLPAAGGAAGRLRGGSPSRSGSRGAVPQRAAHPRTDGVARRRPRPRVPDRDVPAVPAPVGSWRRQPGRVRDRDRMAARRAGAGRRTAQALTDREARPGTTRGRCCCR